MESPRQARAQFEALAVQVRSDPSHPLWPSLLTAARRGGCRSELQALLRDQGAVLEPLAVTPLLALCETAAELGLLEEAIELARRAACAAEPCVALRRGRWALQLGRFDQALQAADIALAGLLQPGLAVDEFLALAARGAPPEGLLRHARGSVARHATLSEPIALRWEAARRLGRPRDANVMRLVCLRYFPERASVWATAGNHALDEGDAVAAAGYFRRCLALDPDWTAALAGTAIVLELQKRWDEALPYRRRVVEVERALEHDTPASLQRVLRYAAALARLERWRDAEPLFRRSVALGAYTSVPAERTVLERVFSRELYAPALIASFRAQVPGDSAPAPEIALALHEATLLASLSRACEPVLLGGLCAWLAGDLARAYTLFDEAELIHEDDLCVQYFLLDAARALDAPEAASIARYAVDRARRVLALAPPSALDEESALYARLILDRHGGAPMARETPVASGPLGLAAFSTRTPLEPYTGGSHLGLRRVAAFRASLRVRGVAPLTAAALSSRALAALCGVD